MIHTVTLKQTDMRKKNKRIAAAVYQYQADNDGEWGEIRFDFENGTAEIVRLADWDTVKSNIFANTAIRFVQCLPEARLLKSVVVPFEMGVPERPLPLTKAAKESNGNSSHTISLRQTECRKTGETITAAVYEYLVDNDGEWGELRFDFENGTAEIVKLADWDTVKSNIFAKTAIQFVQRLPEARMLKSVVVPFWKGRAYGADGKLAEVSKELWTITDEAGTGVDTLADGTLYELRVSIADGGALDLSEEEKKIIISVVLAK